MLSMKKQGPDVCGEECIVSAFMGRACTAVSPECPDVCQRLGRGCIEAHSCMSISEHHGLGVSCRLCTSEDKMSAAAAPSSR
jgi:hypothetical protein